VTPRGACLGAPILTCLLALAGVSSARAQGSPPDGPLPQGDLFRPPVADPKQPHFFASYLWASSSQLKGRVTSVGLGENIGLVRGRGGWWQVSVAAGVFSQFDMKTPSYDLINTDFIVGLPFTWQRGALSGRARVYHQSSHLGDEYLLRVHPERVNLSFEAAELIVSRDFGLLRAYGGGEYLFRHEPSELKPGVLHGGLEWRPAEPVVQLGRMGFGRFVAAVDAKAPEERDWQVGWGALAALEFGPGAVRDAASRRWSIQIHAYRGPTPYGQFYVDNVSSLGVGLHFTL
jgi:uncharacterized protein DUF1207